MPKLKKTKRKIESPKLMINTEPKPEEVSVCRVCLGSSTERYRSIWEPHREATIVQYMVSIANIKAHEDDALPSSICEPCLQELDGAVDWKLKCEHSDCYLHQMAAQLEDEKPPVGDVKSEPDCALDGTSDAGDDWAPLADPPSDEEVPVKCESPAQPPAHRAAQRPTPRAPQCPAPRAAQPQQVQCHDCGELFKSKCKLRVHWKKSHKQIFTCERCKRVFKTFPAFKRHLIAKNRCADPEKLNAIIEGAGKSRKFKCIKCDYVTSDYSHLQAHAVIHTGAKPFQCDLCPCAFTQYSSLECHKERIHQQYKIVSTCQFCGKLLKGRQNVYRHLLTHKKPKLQCDTCKKFFKGRTSLIAHMVLHTGKKAFKCEHCPASFYSRNHLMVHDKNQHSKMYCIKCDLCGYFGPRKNIKRHRVKHNNCNIACGQCGMFFNCLIKYKVHIQKHDPEKKYCCPVCQRPFQVLSSIKKHLETHHKQLLLESGVSQSIKME